MLIMGLGFLRLPRIRLKTLPMQLATALHPGTTHDTWLEQFSNFEELEMLCFRTIALSYVEINDDIAAIMKYQNLRPIDIKFSWNRMHTIALRHRAQLPRVKEFPCKVRRYSSRTAIRERFSGHSLRHLESLELDWSRLMDGDAFRGLTVESCQRCSHLSAIQGKTPQSIPQ